MFRAGLCVCVCQLAWLASLLYNNGGKQTISGRQADNQTTKQPSATHSVIASVRVIPVWYLCRHYKNEALVVLTHCVMYYTGVWLFISGIYTCLHAWSGSAIPLYHTTTPHHTRTTLSTLKSVHAKLLLFMMMTKHYKFLVALSLSPTNSAHL